MSSLVHDMLMHDRTSGGICDHEIACIGNIMMLCIRTVQSDCRPAILPCLQCSSWDVAPICRVSTRCRLMYFSGAGCKSKGSSQKTSSSIPIGWCNSLDTMPQSAQDFCDAWKPSSQQVPDSNRWQACLIAHSAFNVDGRPFFRSFRHKAADDTHVFQQRWPEKMNVGAAQASSDFYSKLHSLHWQPGNIIATLRIHVSTTLRLFHIVKMHALRALQRCCALL